MKNVIKEHLLDTENAKIGYAEAFKFLGIILGEQGLKNKIPPKDIFMAWRLFTVLKERYSKIVNKNESIENIPIDIDQIRYFILNLSRHFYEADKKVGAVYPNIRRK